MDYLIRGSDKLAEIEGFELIGRDEELNRLVGVLMRSSASSVMLTGAGGVGISALIHGLQALKAKSTAPFDVVAKRLLWLDTDQLFALGNPSAINTAFQKVVARLERTAQSILVIEDTKDFIEACRNNGCSHFVNAITSLVKRDKTQVILEVRDEDIELVMKWHSDIRECFTMFDMAEPSVDALRAILKQNAAGLSKAHDGVGISDDAIEMAIELTNKYRTRDPGLSRAQPERSSTLLDRALAAYRLDAHSNIPEADSNKLRSLYADLRFSEKMAEDFEDRLSGLQQAASKNDDGVTVETPEMVELRKKLKIVQDEADKQTAAFETLTSEINKSMVLTADMVVKEFSKISGIDAAKLTEDERGKLLALEGTLNTMIFGQEHATHKLANAVKIARAVKRQSDKPQASFLFAGPSGVGKTEIGKALSAILLNNPKALTRFDMSEYMEKHSVARLIGAPPGYDGFEAGGILTNYMRQNPSRIILFDEIEKAHDDIFNVMLQVLDDGRITDGMGRTVHFDQVIILMTTNLGQPHFLNKELSFEEACLLAQEDLNARYRSEFLNRFAGRQNIVFFKTLEPHHIEKIVSREIDRTAALYRAEGIELITGPTVVLDFCREHYNPLIGGRGLPGFIQANLEPIFADHALAGNKKKLEIGYENSNFTVKEI